MLWKCHDVAVPAQSCTYSLLVAKGSCTNAIYLAKWNQISLGYIRWIYYSATMSLNVPWVKFHNWCQIRGTKVLVCCYCSITYRYLHQMHGLDHQLFF